MPPNPKLIRWFDLIAALLRRSFPASFAELAKDVPAYTGDNGKETVLRMFERDKDELRRAGIAINTVTHDTDEKRYQLKAEAFYLPYLVISGSTRTAAGTIGQNVPGGIGYRRIPTLTVLPEEAVMLRRAAERVRSLEEPHLTRDADQALRKLRHDLPDEFPAVKAPSSSSTDFADLVDAIQRHKTVSFVYFSIGRGERDTRSVHPYGLVFVTGNWYLIAHEPAVQGLRRFRTSRLQELKVNSRAPGSADFTIPADFDLNVHARSRQSWELGDGDAEYIDVRFASLNGDATSAAQYGEQIHIDASPQHAQDGGSSLLHRRFRVRRRDTFLRWLLSFAGDAAPIAPEAAVHDWNELVRNTLTAHSQLTEAEA